MRAEKLNHWLMDSWLNLFKKILLGKNPKEKNSTELVNSGAKDGADLRDFLKVCHVHGGSLSPCSFKSGDKMNIF